MFFSKLFMFVLFLCVFIYSRRSVGWISCIYVFMFFSKLFCCFSVYFCVLFMFSPSLFKLLHLQSNKNTYTNKANINSFEKNVNIKKQKQKYIISQPEPERYLFAVGSRAGYPAFLLFMFLFVIEAFLLFCCVYFCCLFMFSPSLFKRLHLQSKKHI